MAPFRHDKDITNNSVPYLGDANDLETARTTQAAIEEEDPNQVKKTLKEFGYRDNNATTEQIKRYRAKFSGRKGAQKKSADS